MTARRDTHHADAHSAILRTAAALVPRSSRAEWLSDWQSELWYVQRAGNRTQQQFCKDRGTLFFCLGAFNHAACVRRESFRGRSWLRSPFHCLLCLAATAALAAFVRVPAPHGWFMPDVRGHDFLFLNLLVAAMALPVLPAITSLPPSGYVSAPRSPARTSWLWRWMFLGMKFVLIFLIVAYGSLALRPILLPQALLACYVLAFRWVLLDQQRRCPVCLRLLTNAATTTGRRSHTFLDSHATQYLCEKGHGSLHVPETPTTYSTSRWLDPISSST